MLAPPIPANESERLADLRALQILDTPPEERFDRIVRLAARVFDVPTAYIAMVDFDRQWFKAKCGLNADSTGRDISFCGHTIAHDKPLIIPDALLDPRFQDNPLVTHPPYTRFYAGIPLHGHSGHCVGTFCLASPTPRTFSDQEQITLQELAALAEHELKMLDLIQTQHELIETKGALIETQSRLNAELAEAEAYLRSLLPERLAGQINTDWSFIASSRLGGDLFGYHWLNDDQLAIYLHDVCGHGVGASLLSMAVFNAVRRQALPGVRFEEPSEVLAGLNAAFPMEQNNDKFFTIWYGVYHVPTRTLRYASAGHPPAVVFETPEGAPRKLGSPSLMIGVHPDLDFETHSQQVPPGSRLFVYSDGVSEISGADGEVLNIDGLVSLLAQFAWQTDSRVERLLAEARTLQGTTDFTDDFSLVELEFA
jgi:serine phosphatase RsbU (regulator of sigma subunit)